MAAIQFVVPADVNHLLVLEGAPSPFDTGYAQVDVTGQHYYVGRASGRGVRLVGAKLKVRSDSR
jgi:hypothetical protein